MREAKPVSTLGIFAHANAGKTTITEHILYHTKVINGIGKVDSGNTVTDSMRIERERGISIKASLVSFTLGDKSIQLIDTPGHIDFSAEVERSISVLDGAVLVISGVEGIEPQTYVIWKVLKERNIPTIIFVNKMDRLGANYNSTLNSIRERLDKNIIPIVDIEQNNSREILYKDISFNTTVELLSELDDNTLDKYIFSQSSLTEDWIKNRLSFLFKIGTIFPVVGGSALKDKGIQQLLACIEMYIPETKIALNREFSAFVYSVKVVNNQKDLYVKILSGSLNNRSNIKFDSTEQKIKAIYKIVGTKFIPVNEAFCGEIVVINGVDASCGDFIGNQLSDQNYTNFVRPLLDMKVVPNNLNQQIELVEALKILNIEDPYLNVRYDAITNQIYVSLMGEVQSQVIIATLKDRFNLDVEFSNPVVIHKETPVSIGRGIASYTKVSAVEIEITPLPRGSGLVYKSKLSTDFLLKKYQRQTERLVNSYLKQGLNGWEVTDAEVALIGGRFDSMGSDPLHFNIAVPIALMRALKNSKIHVLEPICKYIITFPKEFLRAIFQNLSSKGSFSEITKEDKDQITIIGEATLISMINFSTEIMKITGGRGMYSIQLSKYEIATNQDILNNYIGFDPRNEVKFVINDMGGSLLSLDVEFTKRKKESRAKFKRKKAEKNHK